MTPRRLLCLAGAALLAAAADHARATWSILIVDTRTGEIAVGSATCLTRVDLLGLTPVLIAGQGAVTAQSAGDTTGRNRALIRDMILRGHTLPEILDRLAKADPNHHTRQYGMVDAWGDALTFTGDGAAAWASGRTGRAGDLAWAVQGNILTGPNVVDGAAATIEHTPGDLAAKLMAAMQAARAEGGDGRCSCSSTYPTGCGSPPPGDFKSAHVGYMLVARAEDRDAARALTFAPADPRHFATTDLDADARPDAIATNEGDSRLHTFLNRTEPGGLTLVELGTPIETGIVGVRELLARDVTGDGVDDLVFLGPSSIHLMRGLGDGAFAPTQTTATPGTPARLALGSAGRAAVSLPDDGRVMVYEPTPGGWSPVADLDTGAQPTGVALARVDADAHDDLCVTRPDLGLVTVFRGGPGHGFTPWVEAPTGPGPVDVRVADLDADGVPDLVTANQAGRSLSVLHQRAPGAFERSDLGLLGSGVRVWIADLDADGRLDLLSLSTAVNGIETHLADAEGAFTTVHKNRAGSSQNGLALADMNADGLPDVVSGNAARGLTVMDGLGDGRFPPYDGFAAGDYFLSLNVPNAVAGTPDPVGLLADAFEAWRTTLEGRPDAVRTTAAAPSRVEAGRPFTLRVQARDWRGDPVAPDALGAEAFGLSDAVTVQSVRVLDGGLVEIDAVGREPGTAFLGVRLSDATGTVRLMPDPSILVLSDLADFNADGARDLFDLLAFVTALAAEDPASDLHPDGLFDAADLAAFLGLLLAP